MTWQPGRERIGELLDAGELEQVTADQPIAQLLLDDASRHLATAAAALSSGDLSGAYQLAYDALRKSAASLLAVQGLRATSRGGHVAVQEAVLAQFGSTVRAFRSFGRIRRARNNFEYPSTVTPGPSADDVTDAIAVATQAYQAATTILEQDLSQAGISKIEHSEISGIGVVRAYASALGGSIDVVARLGDRSSKAA